MDGVASGGGQWPGPSGLAPMSSAELTAVRKGCYLGVYPIISLFANLLDWWHIKMIDR
jgi:hypothetical protein